MLQLAQPDVWLGLLSVPISFVFQLDPVGPYNELSLTKDAAILLVREAVLLARSSMEDEELDSVGEATELTEFDLLERLRTEELTLSGVTAMEFDLADPDLQAAGLAACSELLLRDPVLSAVSNLAGWSEFLLRDPVLWILLLQV